MVLPPDRSDGLGIILLNSNADTHFANAVEEETVRPGNTSVREHG